MNVIIKKSQLSLEKMKKMIRKVTINLSVSLASIVLSFILAETGFRVFVPQFFDISQSTIWDPEIGFKEKPYWKGTHVAVNREFIDEIELNSDGFRDREYGEKKDFRIAGLGDSMVFGNGAPKGKDFLSLIEKELGVEVVNMACGSYSTVQEFLTIRRYYSKYKPDLVILGFYIGNDINDNIRDKDFLKGKVGKKILAHSIGEKGAVLSTIKGLLGKSHLYKFVTDRIKSIPFLRDLFIRYGLIKVHKTYVEIYSINQDLRIWKTTFDTIELLKEFSIKNNFDLLFLFIPDKLGVNPTYWQNAVKQRFLNNKEFDKDQPNRILADFLNKNSIDYIDLTPKLRESVMKGKDPYYILDIHLNGIGHKIAALAIEDWLQHKYKGQGAIFRCIY